MHDTWIYDTLAEGNVPESVERGINALRDFLLPVHVKSEIGLAKDDEVDSSSASNTRKKRAAASKEGAQSSSAKEVVKKSEGGKVRMHVMLN